MLTAFNITTPVFVGPLDLLLSLIEKRKLFINDISLAKVTDDFILYIQNRKQMPIEESAHFILIASTLLLIKSKSLLPILTLTEEEESDIHDLEIRLKIYKKIKEASVNINNLFGVNIIFQQSKQRTVQSVFSPDKNMNLLNISNTIKEIIRLLPKHEIIQKAIVRQVISLEEMIDSLTIRISRGLKIKFSEFSSEHKAEKVNVIVSFLAMLELVKQGMIHANQDKNFGDIDMETTSIGVPRYN
ncbi:MAG: segregation/condensation protein A [Patescibacteria group bacterium]